MEGIHNSAFVGADGYSTSSHMSTSSARPPRMPRRPAWADLPQPLSLSISPAKGRMHSSLHRAQELLAQPLSNLRKYTGDAAWDRDSKETCAGTLTKVNTCHPSSVGRPKRVSIVAGDNLDSGKIDSGDLDSVQLDTTHDVRDDIHPFARG
ncbi:hypothetical protein PG989_015476 [Apiospora arundinis]